MTEGAITRTLMIAGFGLVTCVTETVRSDSGAQFTTLRSAVDQAGRRIDHRTWRRVEQVLCAK
ncbi:hypothetical protein LLS1_03630 [Leifsonia sp. LS1]|uniref:hypothetical protein n=1 Tax=unclassified Leifsonia TaxID=2663824 RepID=UPI001CBEA2DE|nr:MULTISPECIES: hypothetical protein [unclassified Leifsonia]UAJ79312.1 hypothetical protein IT072_19290 [Leifsonia sp. ZF2019]GIT78694.1 hypothetical protein LLS1_03630 [Leifsonia sp. LS1]